VSKEVIIRILSLLNEWSEEHNPQKFGGACQCDACHEYMAVKQLLEAELKEHGS
jgi:hypothetical protein